jgi:hypothetical protein
METPCRTLFALAESSRGPIGTGVRTTRLWGYRLRRRTRGSPDVTQKVLCYSIPSYRTYETRHRPGECEAAEQAGRPPSPSVRGTVGPPSANDFLTGRRSRTRSGWFRTSYRYGQHLVPEVGCTDNGRFRRRRPLLRGVGPGRGRDVSKRRSRCRTGRPRHVGASRSGAISSPVIQLPIYVGHRSCDPSDGYRYIGSNRSADSWSASMIRMSCRP